MIGKYNMDTLVGTSGRMILNYLQTWGHWEGWWDQSLAVGKTGLDAIWEKIIVIIIVIAIVTIVVIIFGIIIGIVIIFVSIIKW